MPWTAPRTWTNSEVPTAVQMNQQLRDNLLVLKTPRADTGRFLGLTSSTLDNLSGGALTGVLKTDGGNTVTARHRFNQGTTARLVIPVGVDKWADDGAGGKKEGSLWTEGDYLHHVDQAKQEWRYLGDLISTPAGARKGSLWVEGAGLHYISENGQERRCIFVGSTSVHTDSNALGGSAWVETYVHWIDESGSAEKPGHADITHADHTDHSDHDDHDDAGSAHSDHDDHTDSTAHDDAGTGHGDHTDHVDHSDGPGHADSAPHGDHDDHSDHSDHSDVSSHGDHTDHSDHSDHQDDSPHSDAAADSRPVLVT